MAPVETLPQFDPDTGLIRVGYLRLDYDDALWLLELKLLEAKTSIIAGEWPKKTLENIAHLLVAVRAQLEDPQ
ncbi:hypothetical protein UFOVP468_11 [uncultured Caudovirales phage]|uniref:Uncharacterized protein n=1 Tax=uncultured Caudovirales phage TaxID=2100421 RepID=A0A6J5MFN5_9CAUD|nr:hypothetical protein UFOVP468_11 [uncultured Caudovirales phage]